MFLSGFKLDFSIKKCFYVALFCTQNWLHQAFYEQDGPKLLLQLKLKYVQKYVHWTLSRIKCRRWSEHVQATFVNSGMHVQYDGPFFDWNPKLFQCCRLVQVSCFTTDFMFKWLMVGISPSPLPLVQKVSRRVILSILHQTKGKKLMSHVYGHFFMCGVGVWVSRGLKFRNFSSVTYVI